MSGRRWGGLFRLGVLWLGLAVLAACDNRWISVGSGGGGTPEFWVNFERQSDGTVRFYANDRRLLGVSGSTHWKIGTVSAPAEGYEYTVTVHKKTGSPQGGYGVVFSAADADHFLAVMIDTTQHYKVGKYDKGSGFKVITDWTFAAEITGGYVANTVRVAFTAPNQYRVHFNGDATGIGFEDDDTPPYTSGYFGYLAEVHATDSFPDTPVDVSFTQVTPADIGM